MKPLLASLLPVAAASWMLTPRFYRSMMRPTASLLDEMLDTTLLMPTLRMDRDNLLPAKSSPKYEITNTDKQIQITMDLPGVEAENLDVSVHDDMLSISGHREAKDENSSFSYKFSQSFSLPADLDMDKFEADLTNGVLTVTAPKDPKKLEASVRKIPIAASASTEQPKLTTSTPTEETVVEKEKEHVATA